MCCIASKQVSIYPKNVPSASLVEKDKNHVDVSFISRNNSNNNAYRNQFGNNPRSKPPNHSNSYENSYDNS